MAIETRCDIILAKNEYIFGVSVYATSGEEPIMARDRRQQVLMFLFENNQSMFTSLEIAAALDVPYRQFMKFLEVFDELEDDGLIVSEEQNGKQPVKYRLTKKGMQKAKGA